MKVSTTSGLPEAVRTLSACRAPIPAGMAEPVPSARIEKSIIGLARQKTVP